MQHFKRSEQSAALPTGFILRTAVYTRPFCRVTHKYNISKGRNSQRRPAAALEFDGICGKVFLDHESDLEDDCVIELS